MGTKCSLAQEPPPRPDRGLREDTIGPGQSLRDYRPEDEKDIPNHKKTTDKEADRNAAEKEAKEREARKGRSDEEILI